VVDARVVINSTAPPTDLRYRHMAIFPYPVELEREISLKDGTALLLRPIRPDDADRERAFVATMSDASRYSRFQHSVSALSPEMIARFTQLDYDREMALVAIDIATDQIAGVTRYFPNADRTSVEFAIAVADSWQGRGLGRLLLTALIGCARAAGYRSIDGSILPSNQGMLRLAEQLDFTIDEREDPHRVVRVVLPLIAS